jgi:glycosyltransferase involved in cell wall biosynthesis
LVPAKKIRVLECIRQGQIGGGESHLLSLVENIDRQYFDPVVLSFTDGPMIQRLQQMEVESHIIFTERPFDFLKWNRIKRLIRDTRVDLIHAHGTRAVSNVLWPGRAMKIPVVYTVHGWSFHAGQNPLIRFLRVAGEKYLTSKTDLNISVSLSNQQSGKKYIPSFDSVVINNGIDQKKFNRQRPSENIRKELNVGENELLILFIARFTEHKQPLILIKAFYEAVKIIPGIRLLMVGDGDQKEKALQMVKELSMNERIIFQPFRQDVPAVLAAADIYVLPSLWEGLPIGLLEAMAMGKAIVATNVDGTREIINDHQNGLLTEAGDVPALTNALVELCQNDSLRKKLEISAPQIVNEQFNAVNMTKKIEDIYLNLCNKNPSANLYHGI